MEILQNFVALPKEGCNLGLGLSAALKITADKSCPQLQPSLGKATKFCKISTVDLTYLVPLKSKVEISQNFVAFSECMNFNLNRNWECRFFLESLQSQIDTYVPLK